MVTAGEIFENKIHFQNFRIRMMTLLLVNYMLI